MKGSGLSTMQWDQASYFCTKACFFWKNGFQKIIVLTDPKDRKKSLVLDEVTHWCYFEDQNTQQESKYDAAAATCITSS